MPHDLLWSGSSQWGEGEVQDASKTETYLSLIPSDNVREVGDVRVNTDHNRVYWRDFVMNVMGLRHP